MNSFAIEAKAIELGLAQRFAIARESWDTTTNVFVSVSDGELSGVGEASPASRWGETVESVLAQIDALDLSALAGPFDLEGPSVLLPPGSARSALDIALHDLAGRRAGLSVGELLGLGGRPLPPTSVTVPIASVEEMRQRAASLRDHAVLKVKVGFDGDVDAVRAVREVYDGAIRIDANEGWEADEALMRLKELNELGIELCEQPIPAGDPGQLGRVTAGSPIPVFADEDVSIATDVGALAGAVDGVNLKLRKAGGIRETVRAIAVARAHGMSVMLGCDLDSGVAATAAAHLASLGDYADLDGPLLLAEDPWPGVRYDRGSMTLPGGPGLGCRRARP